MASITIDILAEVSKATAGLTQVTDQLGGLQRTAAAAGPTLKGVLAADIIQTGARAVGDALTDAFHAVEQKSVMAAQTSAVLRSTGNAANVAAADIARMADAIEGKTLIEDDAIVKGANLMLTFTNVKNAAGEGNDIFNRSIGIMADMSQALGTDTTAAATMLGKALNDPVGGISALSRAGVQLTAAQKDQIKSMVAAGDTMGAQKIILGELQTQFGGSAAAAGATFAGAMDNLKDTIDGVLEDAVRPLLPLLQDLAEAAANHLPGAIEQVSAAIDTVTAAAEPARAAISAVIGFMADNPETVTAFAVTLGVLAAAIGAATAVQWAWNAAMTMNPIGLIIVGIAALVAAIVYVATHWDAIRDKVLTVVSDMTRRVLEFVAGVQNWFAGAVRTAGDTFTSLPGRILSILRDIPGHALNIGRDIVIGIANGINGMNTWLFDAARRLADGAITAIKRTLGIASPAREGVEIGDNLAGSTGLGVQRGTPRAIAAASTFARALVAAATPTAPVTLALAGSGATRSPTEVHITVHATPATDRIRLGQELADVLDAYYASTGRGAHA